MNRPKLTIALAGNPNSGKTTIFNALTGSRQHVGNYPGVTVEKKEGLARFGDRDLLVVDLPGTYSLTAYSLEEVVARNFVMEDGPDVVVDVIDASNLERNLYLATQLLELGAPLVLAFNMSDVARARGCRIDREKLSVLLGAPIVETVGTKGLGVQDLLAAAVATAGEGGEAVCRQRRPDYGGEIEPHIKHLEELVACRPALAAHCRWFAVKLLEGDEETARRIARLCPEAVKELTEEAGRLRRHIEGLCGDAAEIILADRRYGFISGACTEAVRQTVEARHDRSDRIDAVLTHRFWGLPIFALTMFLVFQFTFWVGGPVVDWLEAGKDMLAEAVRGLGGPGVRGLLVSLVADGIIEGVGAVVVFVPLIAMLFLGIAVLEDSGYMARAAFLLDRPMHHIGLHGKSFIPMLVAFGCNVPAILATRTLETRRDRLTTMLILPLMSCGARLPVYVLILGAFFPARVALRLLGVVEVTNQAVLLLGIYLAGVGLALIATRIFRATVLRGEVTPFVLELPPYRMPTLKGLLVHMAEPTWHYLRKAGTIILAMVVLLWALRVWPGLPAENARQFEDRRAALLAGQAGPEAGPEAHPAGGGQAALRRLEMERSRAELEYSAIGRIGRALAPVLAPCGFDWKISTALVGAVAAKEVFIGQMGVVYAVEQDDGHSETLRQKLAADYVPLQGVCIMLFILVASPCVAVVAATLRESGSWKWAALQWAYLTAAAWLLTTAVYQLGRILGLGSGIVGG